MSSIYKADPDVVDMVKDLIAKNHPDLVLVVDEIAVVFREKAAQRGGRAVLGKSAKASPLIGVLGDTDYKFVLELGGDSWLELTSRQRNALLDHLLCSCLSVEDDGKLKFSIAPPDVSFFWDELDRWGDWRPRPEGEGPDGPSPVVDVFGKKDEEEEA